MRRSVETDLRCQVVSRWQLRCVPGKTARCTYVVRGMRRRKRMRRDSKRLCCSLRDGNLPSAAMGRCIAAAITTYVSEHSLYNAVKRSCITTVGTCLDVNVLSRRARELSQRTCSGVGSCMPARHRTLISQQALS